MYDCSFWQVVRCSTVVVANLATNATYSLCRSLLVWSVCLSLFYCPPLVCGNGAVGSLGRSRLLEVGFDAAVSKRPPTLLVTRINAGWGWHVRWPGPVGPYGGRGQNRRSHLTAMARRTPEQRLALPVKHKHSKTVAVIVSYRTPSHPLRVEFVLNIVLSPFFARYLAYFFYASPTLNMMVGAP